MSYIGQQTNQQSLNGIIDLTDGTIIIQDGVISNVKSLSLEGELNMNTKNIVNLKDGVNAGDAVNKAQLDAITLNLNDYVKRDGTNSMLGNLNLNSYKITNLATGTANGDAVNKLQMDTADNSRVLKAGDTMTGSLSVNFPNSFIDIRALDESQDSILYLSTPYLNGVGRRKTALIADGITSYSRANLHFCLNQVADNTTSVSVSDSKMCIINSTGNVGIATTSPSEKLDVNGNGIIRGSLNMNTTNKIINVANGTNNLDAVNKSQLDLKADKTYVDASLNLKLNKAGDTMTGNLDMGGNVITSSTNPTSFDMLTRKGYVDTEVNNFASVKVNKAGDTMTGNLNMGSNVITSSTNPTSFDMLTRKGYVDTEVNNFAGLKVNKAGDTMTDYLQLPEVRLTSQTTTYNSGTIDSSNRTNTYAVFDHAGTGNDWAFLRQIGSENDIHLSLDFHDDNNDGKFSLRNVASVETPDTAFTFFNANLNTTTISTNNTSATATPQLVMRKGTNSQDGVWFNTNANTGDYNPIVSSNGKSIIFSNGTKETGDLAIGPWSDTAKGIQVKSTGETYLNKNSSLNTPFTTSSPYYLTSGNTIYDHITITATTPTLYLPATSSGDSSMINKTVLVYFPNSTTRYLQCTPNGNITIIVNGTTYANFATNSIFYKLKIVGSSTIGTYTVVSYDFSIPDNKDQLTLQSNLGTEPASEFTGIRFLNTNTDAGYIRTETDRDHYNSVMRFYTRNSNNIILPLEISNVITANKPIIRKEWTSGEIIKTKIYNQNNSGTGVQIIEKMNNLVPNLENWKTLSYTMDNSVITDSILEISIDAPYLIEGHGLDYIQVRVYDSTSTTQMIVKKTQFFSDNGGGGTRSCPVLPLVITYTPQYATSTKTRTIKVDFYNRGNDDLLMCYTLDDTQNNSPAIAEDKYSIKITEYKK